MNNSKNFIENFKKKITDNINSIHKYRNFIDISNNPSVPVETKKEFLSGKKILTEKDYINLINSKIPPDFPIKNNSFKLNITSISVAGINIKVNSQIDSLNLNKKFDLEKLEKIHKKIENEINSKQKKSDIIKYNVMKNIINEPSLGTYNETIYNHNMKSSLNDNKFKPNVKININDPDLINLIRNNENNNLKNSKIDMDNLAANQEFPLENKKLKTSKILNQRKVSNEPSIGVNLNDFESSKIQQKEPIINDKIKNKTLKNTNLNEIDSSSYFKKHQDEESN